MEDWNHSTFIHAKLECTCNFTGLDNTLLEFATNKKNSLSYGIMVIETKCTSPTFFYSILPLCHESHDFDVFLRSHCHDDDELVEAFLLVELHKISWDGDG